MLAEHPDEKGLEYMPAPSRPPRFDRELKRLVGVSPNGTDLYLRFVWGMDVTEVLDGMTVHRYPDPLGKYVGVDRWVLEGWQSPDVYDRNQWEANKDLFGPWPENGVWDFIETLEDDQKGFLPLSSAKAMKMVREWRHWKSKPKKRALEDLLKNRCEIKVLKEGQVAARKKAIFDKFIRDVANITQPTRDHDPRRRKLIGKITKGEYQPAANGMLIPKLS